MGLVDGAINAVTNAVTGGSGAQDKSLPATGLEDFWSKFTSSEGYYVNTIDPLQTFEVAFKFYPCAKPETTGTGSGTGTSNDPLDIARGVAGEMVGSAIKSVKSGISNAINNMTGGLLAAFDSSGKTVTGAGAEFKNKGKQSFLEYVALANKYVEDTSNDGLLGGMNEAIDDFADSATSLISGKKTETSTPSSPASPLILNIGLYVQNITLPNMKVEYDTSTTVFGNVPIVKGFASPDNNTITMNILNTKASLHERIFYPWMREVTLPFWSYDTQPYTTATITVDYSKHADLRYVFVGCRPVTINSLQATQEPSSDIVRQVTFAFDYMFIASKLDTIDSFGNKLVGAVGGLASAAGAFIGGGGGKS